jgi:hypothetical protein
MVEKVLNYNDTGEWYVEADDGICDDYPHNKILFTSGFVFIRNDFIDQAQYKTNIDSITTFQVIFHKAFTDVSVRLFEG